MTGRRALLLEHFQEPVPPLTLVSDPDGLLQDEVLPVALKKAGVELVDYRDPVSFRYLYESRYRKAVEEGSIRLAVRTEADTLETMPYDLWREGRKLEFRLSTIFPRLSVTVLQKLAAEDLDALYQVYGDYRGSNADTETCDFILRRVYKVPYDTIDNQTGLLKFLLSKHYQQRPYPKIIEDFLLEKLQKVEALRDLPFRPLLVSERFFFDYLQDQWRVFLTGLQEKAKEDREKEGIYRHPGHPFADNDVRRLLDNLFLEGKLKPVTGFNTRLLPAWTHAGLVIDPYEDRKKKLKHLTTKLREKLQNRPAYRDWQVMAGLLGEAKYLALVLAAAGEDTGEELPVLENELEQAFTAWMLHNYSGLKSLPYLPEPVMVHHIPHYLAAGHRGKTALLVLDGMNWWQWVQIREILAGGKEKYNFQERSVFAWAPTLTSVSRQALFSGEIPVYFAGSINTTRKEESFWRLFWENRGLPPQSTLLHKSLGQGEYEPVPGLEKAPVKAAGLVIDIIDKFLHRSLQGEKGLYAELQLWVNEGYPGWLIHDLLAKGFQVFITSDHGNKESRGVGTVSEGVLAETEGERARIYRDKDLRDEAAARYPSLTWTGDGLPEDFHVLLARNREAFIKKDTTVVSHGGISLEEIVVPFIQVTGSEKTDE